MTTIRGMLNKLEKLDVAGESIRIIQRTSYEAEALNKEQLYNYGVRRDGTKIKPEYKSAYYDREKNYMNRRPGYGTPDLFLTGSFFKGFTVSIDNYSLKIDSLDSKSEGLKARYSADIFGLTLDNRRVYAIGIFYTELKKYITLNTGLPFSS